MCEMLLSPFCQLESFAQDLLKRFLVIMVAFTRESAMLRAHSVQSAVHVVEITSHDCEHLVRGLQVVGQ